MQVDLQKILDASRSNPELQANFSFKLEVEMKERFVQYCSDEGLSTGAVLRSLLAEFLEAAGA